MSKREMSVFLQVENTGPKWNRSYILRELDKVCFSPPTFTITGNKNAEKLAKEAKNLNNDNIVNITLLNGKALANFKLRENSIPVKHQICNIRGDHLIIKTIARPMSTKSRPNSPVASTSKDGVLRWPACEEEYCDPPTEEWIRCCKCQEWFHEECSNY
ncbi:uncharacterized protein TNCV_4567741 [Trichonephila clavipes]|nr:uncharacterized protein TNCV_4567741 [Trichonephila clavipes]